jgi:glycosyltransferase involved in cell wall biosynthesis
MGRRVLSSSTPRPRLTFIFPAYNEEANIDETMRRALAQIAPLVPSIEVLIVDDGSVDATSAKAEALAVSDPRVRVIRLPHRGVGSALKGGFREARGELVGYSDADLQFDLSEVRLLLQRMDAAGAWSVDAVVGYRIRRQDPLHRVIIGRIYSAIVSSLFDLRVRDVDCAMKLFRGRCLEDLGLESDGPFLIAETLIRLKSRGAGIAQVGVHHFPRTAGINAGAAPAKILRTLADLARLRWRLWLHRT